jgi:hypothetical protein
VRLLISFDFHQLDIVMETNGLFALFEVVNKFSVSSLSPGAEAKANERKTFLIRLMLGALAN